MFLELNFDMKLNLSPSSKRGMCRIVLSPVSSVILLAISSAWFNHFTNRRWNFVDLVEAVKDAGKRVFRYLNDSKRLRILGRLKRQ